MPDIFVSSDTADLTKYSQKIFSSGMIAQYTLKYCDVNRRQLSKMKGYKDLDSYLSGKPLVEELVQFAKSRGISPNREEINKSYKVLQRSIHSNIIYQIQGMLEHVKYINLDDPTVLKAVEVLEKGEAFP